MNVELVRKEIAHVMVYGVVAHLLDMAEEVMQDLHSDLESRLADLNTEVRERFQAAEARLDAATQFDGEA